MTWRLEVNNLSDLMTVLEDLHFQGSIRQCAVDDHTVCPIQGTFQSSFNLGQKEHLSLMFENLGYVGRIQDINHSFEICGNVKFPDIHIPGEGIIDRWLLFHNPHFEGKLVRVSDTHRVWLTGVIRLGNNHSQNDIVTLAQIMQELDAKGNMILHPSDVTWITVDEEFEFSVLRLSTLNQLATVLGFTGYPAFLEPDTETWGWDADF